MKFAKILNIFVKRRLIVYNLVPFSSVHSSPTLCDPVNRITPGLPVHHQLPEFTQTHVRWVGDAIQPSHSLSSPFPPAPNPSQHQSLFQWVNSSHEVAKVLEYITILPLKFCFYTIKVYIGKKYRKYIYKLVKVFISGEMSGVVRTMLTFYNIRIMDIFQSWYVWPDLVCFSGCIVFCYLYSSADGCL